MFIKLTTYNHTNQDVSTVILIGVNAIRSLYRESEDRYTVITFVSDGYCEVVETVPEIESKIDAL